MGLDGERRIRWEPLRPVKRMLRRFGTKVCKSLAYQRSTRAGFARESGGPIGRVRHGPTSASAVPECRLRLAALESAAHDTGATCRRLWPEDCGHGVGCGQSNGVGSGPSNGSQEMPSRNINLGIRGRTVVVTGAAGALGSAIAVALRRAGANVIGLDLVAGPDIRRCDVTKSDETQRVIAEAITRDRTTDIVHAAGILALGSVDTMSAADFRRVIEVNLVGSFIVAQAAIPLLARGTTLTFISSQAGLKGGGCWSAYSASKAGVHRLVDCLVEETVGRGIRINALCPGSVESPMMKNSAAELSRITGESIESIMSRYQRGIPLGRIASMEEVAHACLLLISPLSSYVHGTALVVDGGELTR